MDQIEYIKALKPIVHTTHKGAAAEAVVDYHLFEQYRSLRGAVAYTRSPAWTLASIWSHYNAHNRTTQHTHTSPHSIRLSSFYSTSPKSSPMHGLAAKPGFLDSLILHSKRRKPPGTQLREPWYLGFWMGRIGRIQLYMYLIFVASEFGM